MAQQGFLRRLWLTRLSRPAGERVLHRHVLGRRPQRVMEVGLGLLVRTERLLHAIGSGPQPVQYVGLDRFESRDPGDPPGVSLKEAHRRLHALARVQLVPGTIDTSLARLCNHLGSFDLVLVSAIGDERQMERSWFFLQRIVTGESTVFVESRGDRGSTWSVMSKSRIDELAARATLRRAG